MLERLLIFLVFQMMINNKDELGVGKGIQLGDEISCSFLCSFCSMGGLCKSSSFFYAPRTRIRESKSHL